MRRNLKQKKKKKFIKKIKSILSDPNIYLYLIMLGLEVIMVLLGTHVIKV